MTPTNWDDSKGNPFDYTFRSYTDIVSSKPVWAIEKCVLPSSRVKCQIDFNHHLKTIATLDIRQINVIKGINAKSDLTSLYDNLPLNTGKPVIAWLKYPFDETVKATIYPLVRIFEPLAGDQNVSPKRIVSGIGYYVWQIALVYADIYKNHYQKVGIWGLAFEDLYLEFVNIHVGNTLTLGIGAQ